MNMDKLVTDNDVVCNMMEQIDPEVQLMHASRKLVWSGLFF